MSKKIFLRAAIFFIALALLIGYLNCVFTFPRGETSDMARERFNTFYAQPEGTIDSVYIGSSGVDRYWIPSIAWKDYGMTVYDFTSGNQPLVFAKYMMEEAAKKQNIKLFILEIRGALRGPENINDTDIRRVTDNLRLSSTKIKATKAVLDYVGQGDTEIDTGDLSYYFKLAKYHSKWNGNFDIQDWTDLFPETEYMGYFAYNDVIFKIRKQDKPVLTNQKAELPEANKEILEDLLEYCKTLDAEVLFVSSPQCLSLEEQEQFNYVMDEAEKAGFDTINFNTEKMYEILNWDFAHDMYNSGHANIYGALKYTGYLSEYIQENYELEDHRDDGTDYEQWDESYKALLNRIKEKKQDIYNELASSK